ncbi:AraC family transcriptional regulator [Hydrotalea sandarakina]|jgi:AraC-like DNA-binding protein|uniref:AraC-like DNA-binding protein n=1 Tax=Hydrotalea sandarakina TaxID=1004304 RepID=A0A2W7RLX3_9BACT|nr:AraC family transcriptional regulator [Hydrotalea sandarakina]PZX61783.1 AraC-like DNA-binding protein [Hydrotalea sandarakina]
MQPLIQKIHIEQDSSFACRTYRTPNFETNWHMHEEYELILITEGNGTALIGDYVGNYNTGDIFFLSGNLPHWFRKAHHKMIGSAIVVHFTKQFWGETFLSLPELKTINQLLTGPNNGIQLNKNLRAKIAKDLIALEKLTGFNSITQLLQSLYSISTSKEITIITSNFSLTSSSKENSVIEKIFEYSLKNYLKHITLEEVAALAEMSIPTFCRFFKKNIKKSYFDFLQELRIGHACKLLQASNDNIIDICYNSGYNSWAHFSKQFKKIKQVTPSQYRKQFKAIA